MFPSNNPLSNKLADQIQEMMKKGCKADHQKVTSSLNSYKYDEKSATLLIQRKIKELKFELPPTRQTLIKLFESLNLLLPMVRAIECILHCRGLKMEKSDPAEFQVEKLYEWFHLNLRTLQHISFEEIDQNWLQENKHVVEQS
jgi:hypothetical protein